MTTCGKISSLDLDSMIYQPVELSQQTTEWGKLTFGLQSPLQSWQQWSEYALGPAVYAMLKTEIIVESDQYCFLLTLIGARS